MNRQSTTFLAITLVLVIMITACKKEEQEDIGFEFDSVNGFVINDQGEKLLATNMGLCSLDVSNGSYVAMENELGENALGDNSISDLVYSNSNLGKELWLASNKGAYNYTTETLLNEENSGLQNNQVSQIGFNPKQIAFFAASDGISLLNNNIWTHYTGLSDFFLQHEISDIGSASNGYTYVTTYGGGIERFKADVDGISGATLMDTDWTGLESNYIHSLFIDDTTQVYATNEGVAFHYSEYTKWDWEVYTTHNSDLINDTVLSVTRDQSGLWWIGTADGISTFDESNWHSFTANEHDLCSKRIQYFAIDTDGTLWAASDQGLSHYANGVWVCYPK